MVPAWPGARIPHTIPPPSPHRGVREREREMGGSSETHDWTQTAASAHPHFHSIITGSRSKFSASSALPRSRPSSSDPTPTQRRLSKTEFRTSLRKGLSKRSDLPVCPVKTTYRRGDSLSGKLYATAHIEPSSHGIAVVFGTGEPSFAGEAVWGRALCL